LAYEREHHGDGWPPSPPNSKGVPVCHSVAVSWGRASIQPVEFLLVFTEHLSKSLANVCLGDHQIIDDQPRTGDLYPKLLAMANRVELSPAGGSK
jgi:hypothetical protein